MSDDRGTIRAYSWTSDTPEQSAEVVLRRHEAFSGEFRPLSIRDIQSQMGHNLRRWYPDKTNAEIAEMSFKKVVEELAEWVFATPEERPKECPDVLLSMCGFCAMSGIDLQSQSETKLAIVSARTDQAERDRERGITAPEPPTLRPGATIRAKHDTKSINGLNIPKDQLLRVLNVAETMITARIGEHGEGLVCTVKSGDVEVVG